MPFCPKCGKYSEGANFCPNCGTTLTAPTAPVVARPEQKRGGGGGSGAVAAILLLIVVIGAFLYFAQPHGSSGNPLGCFPHQETIYVGYVQTATDTFQINEASRITQFSYDKGVLLYTVYLTNDQGQQFQYHYVTAFNLTPSTIVTGC